MGEEGAKKIASGNGGLFPEAVKHYCRGTGILTRYYADAKCETEMTALFGEIKWGDCFDFTADGKTQYITITSDKALYGVYTANDTTIASASTLKAAVAAAMALAATQF